MKHVSRLLCIRTEFAEMLFIVILNLCLNHLIYGETSAPVDKSKVVITSLDAKWHSTPLMLEVRYIYMK